jgi:hypothetical protein
MGGRISLVCLMLAASGCISDGMRSPKNGKVDSGRGKLSNAESAMGSTDGKSPSRVLWIKKLSPLVSAGEGVVLWKNLVAASIGGSVVILDVDSGAYHRWGSRGPELFQTIAVDDDGRFLVAGQSAYAIDGEGKTVWAVALPGEPPIMDDWAQCRLAYWRESGLLVAGCNNGYVSGVQAGKTGRRAWSHRMYREGAFNMSVGPGSEGRFVTGLGSGHDGEGTQLLDGKNGKHVLALGRGTGAVFSANSAGFLVASPSLSLIDWSGRVQWQVKPDGVYRMATVAGVPDERVLVMERVGGEPPRLSIFSLRTGKRVAGPEGQGTPVAAGADGTFYALSCDIGSGETSTSAPRLVAYDGLLKEMWSVELPVPARADGHRPCPRPGVALGLNGVMYVLVESGGTYLMAVQTNSPGPAATAWPLRFGGNGGWRWAN